MDEIEIEMPDGTILAFPAGTSDDVMQGAAQRYWAENNPEAAAPAPEPAPAAPAAPAEPARPRTAEQQVIDGVYARLSEPLSEDFIGDQFSGPDPFAALHPDLQAGLDEINEPNFVEGVSASIGRGAPFIDAAGANIRGAITGEDPERLRLNREQQAAAFADRMPQTADVAASVPSGISRGITGLGDLASFAGEAIGQGVDALTGGEFDLPEFGRVTGAVEAAQGAPFSAPTTDLGGYAQTVSEFASGAAAMGARSLSALGRYGVAPGVAFEGAGQALEGSPMQVPAQIAAALATPAALSRLGSQAPDFTRRTLMMGQRLDPTRAEAATRLAAGGVVPTVGQVSRSPLLRAIEGTADLQPEQVDDFTVQALRAMGVSDGMATPEVLDAGVGRIVQAMDDATVGVAARIGTTEASRAMAVVDDIASVPATVRGVVDGIADIGTRPGGGAVPAEVLNSWRSDLGRLMRSGVPETREAAYAVREILEDTIEAGLQAAGRADDYQALRAAREQYRNFLFIARSVSSDGRVTPGGLYQAARSGVGRETAARGNGTGLLEMARDADATLKGSATTSGGGVRAWAGADRIGSGAGLGGLGFVLGASPEVTAAMAAGGMALPSIARRAISSNTGQTLMREPGRVAQRVGRVAPGIAAGVSEGDATARLMSAGFTPQQAIAIIQRGPAAIEAALGE